MGNYADYTNNELYQEFWIVWDEIEEHEWEYGNADNENERDRLRGIIQRQSGVIYALRAEAKKRGIELG